MKNFWKYFFVAMSGYCVFFTIEDLIKLIFTQQAPSFAMLILWGVAMLLIVSIGLHGNIKVLIDSKKKPVIPDIKLSIKANAKVITKEELTSNHIVVDSSKYEIELEENELVVIEIDVN